MNLRLVSVVVSASFIVGCESLNKQMLGMGIGATVCGVGGGAAAKGMGASTTTAVGVGVASAALCGWAGSKIGEMLDERDRKLHQETVTKALDTGKNQAWNSQQSGASGQIQVKDAPTPAVEKAPQTTQQAPAQKEALPMPAPAPQTVVQGPICRTISQTIRLKDGTTKTEDLTACRDTSGEWKTQGA